MKKICIIIPTFNRRDCIRNLLLDIHHQSANDIKIHTIVVVDGSTDGTMEMLSSEFPVVQTIEGDGNWWFTRCLNEGCKQAVNRHADYILTLNDDVEIRSNFIQHLLDSWNRIPQSSLIGCLAADVNHPHTVTFSGVKSIHPITLKQKSYLPSGYNDNQSALSGLYPSESLTTRGLLIPSEVFKTIGFFDEAFIQYGSDEDFCLRAKKAGYPLFINWDAKVFSHVEKTSGGNAALQPSFFRFIRSFFDPYSCNSIGKAARFYLRHGIPWLIAFYLPYYVLGNFKALYFTYRK